jgi:hypothetical protein
MKYLAVSLVALLLLVGCSQQQPAPRQIVILVDISASIEPQAEAECLDAIAKLIAKLNRGDSVSIIPITGDAEVQSTGRVLRFQKPITRAAYDADLIGFSRQVHDSLQALRIQAIGNPSARTDIFGAVRMAMEEFAAGPKEQDRRLIIFSDFIEDDGAVNFNTDRRLMTVKSATSFATDVSKGLPPAPPVSARASLGLLRSKEFHRLTKERREAIRQFWRRYFKSIGIESNYMSDGVGLLLRRDVDLSAY